MYTHLGDNRKYWDQFTSTLKQSYPELVMEWKYYKDAKRWLLPVERKKKNLFWVSFIDDTFIASFWFGPKLVTLFLDSELSEAIKEEFRNAEQNKMGRGLAVKVYSDADLEKVFRLVNFKANLK